MQARGFVTDTLYSRGLQWRVASEKQAQIQSVARLWGLKGTEGNERHCGSLRQ